MEIFHGPVYHDQKGEKIMTEKPIVAYFSATGQTERLAKTLAEAADGNLFEIQPEVPYTRADLDWKNPKSRSSVEMNDSASRPAITGLPNGIMAAKVIYVGFPIWWYTAPSIIKTFLDSFHGQGKTIVPFATSGGSPMGNASAVLQTCTKGTVLEGKRFMPDASKAQLEDWVKSLNLPE